MALRLNLALHQLKPVTYFRIYLSLEPTDQTVNHTCVQFTL